MDGSDTRRGQPAMHRRFAGLHRSAEWHGDPEAFGMSAAILLGDLCLIWADELLNTSGMAVDALLRTQPVYDEMRVELMAGQYLDLLEQAVGGGTVESALRVARYKSAKYTIEKPLHMGAALAGAAPELTEALHGVRPAAGRGVPAARRRPGRVRRPQRDRQARRRRPARGQAHRAGGDGAEPRRPRADRASYAGTSATRTWARTGWPSCARSSSRPGPSTGSSSSSPSCSTARWPACARRTIDAEAREVLESLALAATSRTV